MWISLSGPRIPGNESPAWTSLPVLPHSHAVLMKPPSFWEPNSKLFNIPAFLQVPDKRPAFWQMEDNQSKPAYRNQEGEFRKKERRLIPF